jgi:hypothetical protein
MGIGLGLGLRGGAHAGGRLDRLAASLRYLEWTPWNPATLWQDTGGTVPAGSGDTVALAEDIGASSLDLVQGTTSLQPLVTTLASGATALEFDLVDDYMEATFSDQFIGTMIVGTESGTYAMEVGIPAGAFSFGRYELFPIVGVLLVEGGATEAQRYALMDYMVGKGAGPWDGAFSAETSLGSKWREQKITTIYPEMISSATNVTSFAGTFYANQITAIPVGLFDNNPNVTSFASTFRGNQITDVPANLFDTQTVCTNYGDCFMVGNILTQQSVENVLVSVNYSATTNSLTNGTLGLRGDGSALSAAAIVARDSLLALGWTLTLDNVA